jgi:glycosyltransferase involved in cell wall biosynthesis
MNTQVSVIIPNYNHAPYLAKRINSVLGQTYPDFEVILLDDCSTDGSREIIELYRNHPNVSQVLLNETNSGSTFKQWNKGIALARGEYIWIAESDDFADANFLEKTLPIIRKDDTIGLVFCHSVLVDKNDQTIGNTQDWVLPHETWDTDSEFVRMPGINFCAHYLTGRCVIPNASAVLFRKKYFVLAGGADESRKMTGDWRMWFDMLMQSDVVMLNQNLNYFRYHTANVRTSKAAIMREETLSNVKYFHRALMKRGVQNRQILQRIFDWAFKEAIWKRKYIYSRANIRLYFQEATPQMIVFFIIEKLPAIIQATLIYRLKKLGF